MKELTTHQRYELIGQYVDKVVDRMDTQSLIEWVTEDLFNRYDNMSDSEFKEYIIEMEHEVDDLDKGVKLYDELVDNVTKQTLEVN